MLASAILASAAVLTACGPDSTSEHDGALGSTQDLAGGPAPSPPLDIRAVVAEPSYLPGDTVEISFTFTNTGEDQISVRHFPPRIEFIRPSELQPTRSYPEGSTERMLSPGETLEHFLAWDQRDTSGQQVTPGNYYIQVGEILIGEASWGPMNSGNTIGLDKILIRYPQGALEADLEPGLLVTTNGVDITLDRAEFSASTTRLYVSVVPPGYQNPDAVPDDPDRPVMPPMSLMPFDPVATYRIDSGPTVDAGGGSFRPREKDILVTWDLDPLPADAREFTFTVSSLGRWSGPWVFQLELHSP